MALRGWAWDAVGPAAVGDRPLLEALEVGLRDEAVAAAIEAIGMWKRRPRLPTHLMVRFVVAMGPWAGESMRHALAEVVAGWREQPQARRAGSRPADQVGAAPARAAADSHFRGQRATAVDGARAEPLEVDQPRQVGGVTLDGPRQLLMLGTDQAHQMD